MDGSFEDCRVQYLVDILLILRYLIVDGLLHLEDAVAADKIVTELVIVQKLETVCDIFE